MRNWSKLEKVFCFNSRNRSFSFWLSLSGFSIVLFCATFAHAQTASSKPAGSSFEVVGKVVAKSERRFEVQTRDGELTKIEITDSSEFALRLTNPWFDAERRRVVVDGKADENGQPTRLKFALPEGKLYLLAQFRSRSHRNRIINVAPWRLTNYLVGSDPIEANLPKDDDLFLAGELDLANSALIIDGKSWPIVLGYRGATLRDRTFNEIVVGETEVMVTGTKTGESKIANTVLFVNR